jgi:hypothetical protein
MEGFGTNRESEKMDDISLDESYNFDNNHRKEDGSADKTVSLHDVPLSMTEKQGKGSSKSK